MNVLKTFRRLVQRHLAHALIELCMPQPGSTGAGIEMFPVIVCIGDLVGRPVRNIPIAHIPKVFVCGS